jgi:hypothetical protein
MFFVLFQANYLMSRKRVASLFHDYVTLNPVRKGFSCVYKGLNLLLWYTLLTENPLKIFPFLQLVLLFIQGTALPYFPLFVFIGQPYKKKLFNDVPFASSEGPGIGIPANFGFTSLAVVNASMITVFKV